MNTGINPCVAKMSNSKDEPIVTCMCPSGPTKYFLKNQTDIADTIIVLGTNIIDRRLYNPSSQIWVNFESYEAYQYGVKYSVVNGNYFYNVNARDHPLTNYEKYDSVIFNQRVDYIVDLISWTCRLKGKSNLWKLIVDMSKVDEFGNIWSWSDPPFSC